MKRPGIIWWAGDAASQSEIERAHAAGLDRAMQLHESAHRTVYHIDHTRHVDLADHTDHTDHTDHVAAADWQPPATDPSSLVLKVHHTGTGRHAFREALKRRIGRSPARREWRALESLHENGVSVPRPRAWGRLPSGDEIVVSNFLEGVRLGDRFRDARPEGRRELVNALARTIQKLHRADYRHGDLHLGNLWVHGDHVYLLDLESARPQRNSGERLLDLAQLEFSLSRAGWDSTALTSLRDHFGANAHFAAVLRHFLRDHLRGRARRVLRIGRNWSVAEVGARKGLRESSLADETLATLIESSEGNTEAQTRRGQRIRITEESANDRRVLVKRVAAGSVRRALGDRLRGSSAARAFRAGQRLALLSNHAARPLAYLEERRFGIPIRSWLVLEKVGQEDLDHFDPRDPEVETRVATALGAWLADAHAWGLFHRDLKGGNIRVEVGPESIRFWLIDLEDLIGPTESSDALRLRSLSQLNASLPDDAFGLEARRTALDRYLAHAPFATMEARTIASEIARRSLARKHHWRGHGCHLANDEIALTKV
jgi:tRNA A-37 threonylcarbamoyl transferase component Bud32